MRLIKFRAWDKRRKAFYADHQNSESFAEDLGNDNYVLQQFTGLLDKNGKEIYEGDICEYADSYNEKRANVITWDERKAAFYIPGRAYPIDYKIEVMGNIYENPELLQPA